MKVCDIIQFRKDKYFNGAVQTEWFYDSERVKRVAESFVFHGPRYFGVAGEDVELGGHRLVDTATFALKLTERIYDSKPANPFIMTIAGYGAGKSHLAVSLAALFSGEKELVKLVTDNIRMVDAEIADKIQGKNSKKNLVIAINGMNNFNLDAEILRCVRIELKRNKLKDDVLKKLTKSYDIGRHFVENTFENYSAKFTQYASIKGLNYTGEKLKQYILKNMESDVRALEVVNLVYTEINGDSIHWDRGLSAGDILTAVCNEFCGPNRKFNKIIILFDEFGRYIEYVAANPMVAGEAALQQIFEAVQNASGNIIFAGFIQNELDAYLARIEKTSNIVRYVGRYKNSEKMFLSSNFETILANLIEDSDKSRASAIDGAIKRYEAYYNNIHKSLNRWDRNTRKKRVWTSKEMFDSVILHGCYPFHPVTVWLLSNMNNWMQQRSTIAFASEMVDQISERDFNENWLPYVYPVDIINSGIYDELLNAEEKGLVPSQSCMLFREIINKIGDKLTDNELNVLKSILIIKIARFALADKADALTAIKYCCSLKETEISAAMKSLEYMHGVIAFDENSNTFDLIAEASGFNEFKRVYIRYQNGMKLVSVADYTDELATILSLTDVVTSFAQIHNVTSSEWRFRQTILDCSLIDEICLRGRLQVLMKHEDGDSARGEIIYAYCSTNAEDEIVRLSKLYDTLKLDKYPLIILFLDDSEKEIVKALTRKAILNNFSTADNQRFQKYVVEQHRIQDGKIRTEFTSLVQNRRKLSNLGLLIYEERLSVLCTKKFEEVYSAIPPFMFDGFGGSGSQAAPRRYLANICEKLFDKTLTNVQSYNALARDEKNRVKAVLSVGSTTSWGVFNNDCMFVKPMNKEMAIIFDEVDKELEDGKAKDFNQLFRRYLGVPYGMNLNAITLFMFYYIAYKDRNLLCYYGAEKLQVTHVKEKIFKNSKIQVLELEKVRLQRNENVNRDLVLELCQEILQCQTVEQCILYKKQLEDVKAQEGVSNGNQLIVSRSETRINDAINLRGAIYDKLKTGRKIIEESKSNFFLPKFATVFACLVNTNGLIESDQTSSKPFQYSSQYIKEMDALKTDVKNALDRNFATTLKRMRCDITQLSQFKNAHKNVARILRDNGYDEYADELEKRILEVEQETRARDKYKKAFVDLDRDLAMFSNVSGFGFDECESALDKLNGWNTFFEGIVDIPKSILDRKQESIKDAIVRINNRKVEIEQKCCGVINSLTGIQSKDGLSVALRTMSDLQSKGVGAESNDALTFAMRQISEACEAISALPETIDELDMLMKADEFSKYGKCELAVRAEAELKLQVLLQKQDDWVEKYIIPVETKASSMGVYDCTSWITRTTALPVYFDNATAERYKRASETVNAQLHKSNVDGVYAMYCRLDEKEKEEFRKRIF